MRSSGSLYFSTIPVNLKIPVDYEEITAMSHSDKDVAQIFCDAEIEATENLSNLLISNGFNSTNIKEKSHKKE